MKRTALLFILLCFCTTVISCGKNQELSAPSPFERLGSVERGPSVTVNIGEFIWSQEDSINTLQKIVTISDYDISFYAARTNFEHYLTELILALQTETNYMAVIDSQVLEYLRENQIPLGGIVSVAQEIIPDYLQETDNFVTSQMEAIPCGRSTMDSAAQTAVIVQKDLYEAFDRELSSWSDYKSFLSFAQERDSSIIPGRVPTTEYIWIYNRAALLDLYFPEAGYLPLDSYLGASLGLCMDAEGHVIPLEQTHALRLMGEEVLQMREDNLIKLSYSTAGWRTTKRFASALINTADYTSHQDIISQGLAYDTSEYEMCLLYSGSLPMYDSPPDYYLVMGVGCNPTEFFRLLNDLTQDISLYRTVLFGEEGVDYTLDAQGRLIPITRKSHPGNGSVIEWRYYEYWLLEAFADNQMEALIPRAAAPGNFYEEMRKLAYARNEHLERVTKIFRSLPEEVEGTSVENLCESRLIALNNYFMALYKGEEVENFEDWPDVSALVELLNRE